MNSRQASKAHSTSNGAAAGNNRKPIDWLVHVAAPLLGLVGAVLYAVLRLSYLFFYLQVRATPEDVGYGYVEILATQVVGAIELVLIVTILIFLTTLGFQYTVRMAGGVRRASRRFPEIRPEPREVRRVARRSAVAAVMVVIVLLPTLAWLMGAEAKKGYAVRNVYPRGVIALPILAVQAVPARVFSVADPGSARIDDRQCLLYLGSNDGTAIFYDVSNRESIRFPSSTISIVLPFTNRVPYGC